MLKTILFDFDGTLVCTDNLVCASFNHMFETYSFPKVPLERVKDAVRRILQLKQKANLFGDYPVVEEEEKLTLGNVTNNGKVSAKDVTVSSKFDNNYKFTDDIYVPCIYVYKYTRLLQMVRSGR